MPDPTQPLSEEVLAPDMARCFFCPMIDWQKNMFAVDVDVVGNHQYLCADCYASGMLE